MSDTGWIKSSRSSGASDNCVEVRLTGTEVGVRDSKNPTGAVHTFPTSTWRSFLTALKTGDLPEALH
ncbi:DUF397 domain-containing protein [Actinopolyspora mortivallis]|uniref:DUF397 domain-containing protein n=1 Tax=Actinopolyspora mortivallis TaxID=33906 RepID=UPI000376C5B5|nr:DUF397 domain-containing protein [Actinopolyspora mortivallis]